jgi:xanthine dehydrogenase accessory factor
MKDLLEQIRVWLGSGHSVALATVIKTWGSSPRPIGSGMAVSQGGLIAGSVSGGCVESAVIQSALEVIETGNPIRLHFGVQDSEAWAVGLACGGEIEIFIRPFLIDDLRNWDKALTARGSFCCALLISDQDESTSQEYFLFEDGRESFPKIPSDFEMELVSMISENFHSGKSYTAVLQGKTPVEMFVNIIQPPLKLILVGGVHIAIPLVSLAEILGFEITVVDPRRLFSTQDRFPGIHLIPEWPSSAFQKIQLTHSSAVVMLTHDPKIDDPALRIALESPAFYVGALGSKKTHQDRLIRLQKAGVPEEKLSKIYAPVGLDLGGRSPEDIALSILAQIIQVWNHPT